MAPRIRRTAVHVVYRRFTMELFTNYNVKARKAVLNHFNRVGDSCVLKGKSDELSHLCWDTSNSLLAANSDKESRSIMSEFLTKLCV